MKINNVQNYNPAFSAKLKVTTYSGYINKQLLENLEKKAAKIGFEHDTIEMKFTHLHEEREDYYCGHDRCFIYGCNKYIENFKAKFISGNKELQKEKVKIIADDLGELSDKEGIVANKYLDNLYKLFGSNVE